MLGCPIHNGSQEKTYCDAKLVASNNRTSDPFGQSLGLIHGNYEQLAMDCKPLRRSTHTLGGDQADSEAGEKATSNEQILRGSGSLKSDTEIERQHD